MTAEGYRTVLILGLQMRLTILIQDFKVMEVDYLFPRSVCSLDTR
jgi:hypothetical protein